MRWSPLVTDYGLYNDIFCYSTSRYMVKIAGTKYFILFGRLNDMKQLQNVVKSPPFCFRTMLKDYPMIDFTLSK